MEKEYIVVVAHPDDEILFFSSLLINAKKIIVCFQEAKNKTITEGRKKVVDQIPIDRIEWLRVPQSNVYLASDWDNPFVNHYGVKVNQNSETYIKNFETLKEKLKLDVNKYTRIYTHNPWGEYGHEEHVQVFRAILDLSKDLNNEIYVSGYVSDRSYKLFKKEEHFLNKKLEIKELPVNLCDQVKNIYIKNECWTWKENYKFPYSEIFFQIDKKGENKLNFNSDFSAHHPLVYLSYSFKPIQAHWLKRLIFKLIPKPLKMLIKKYLYISN